MIDRRKALDVLRQYAGDPVGRIIAEGYYLDALEACVIEPASAGPDQ